MSPCATRWVSSMGQFAAQESTTEVISMEVTLAPCRNSTSVNCQHRIHIPIPVCPEGLSTIVRPNSGERVLRKWKFLNKSRAALAGTSSTEARKLPHSRRCLQSEECHSQFERLLLPSRRQGPLEKARAPPNESDRPSHAILWPLILISQKSEILAFSTSQSALHVR